MNKINHFINEVDLLPLKMLKETEYMGQLRLISAYQSNYTLNGNTKNEIEESIKSTLFLLKRAIFLLYQIENGSFDETIGNRLVKQLDAFHIQGKFEKNFLDKVRRDLEKYSEESEKQHYDSLELQYQDDEIHDPYLQHLRKQTNMDQDIKIINSDLKIFATEQLDPQDQEQVLRMVKGFDTWVEIRDSTKTKKNRSTETNDSSERSELESIKTSESSPPEKLHRTQLDELAVLHIEISNKELEQSPRLSREISAIRGILLKRLGGVLRNKKTSLSLKKMFKEYSINLSKTNKQEVIELFISELNKTKFIQPSFGPDYGINYLTQSLYYKVIKILEIHPLEYAIERVQRLVRLCNYQFADLQVEDYWELGNNPRKGVLTKPKLLPIFFPSFDFDVLLKGNQPDIKDRFFSNSTEDTRKSDDEFTFPVYDPGITMGILDKINTETIVDSIHRLKSELGSYRFGLHSYDETIQMLKEISSAGEIHLIRSSISMIIISQDSHQCWENLSSILKGQQGNLHYFIEPTQLQAETELDIMEFNSDGQISLGAEIIADIEHPILINEGIDQTKVLDLDLYLTSDNWNTLSNDFISLIFDLFGNSFLSEIKITDKSEKWRSSKLNVMGLMCPHCGDEYKRARLDADIKSRAQRIQEAFAEAHRSPIISELEKSITTLQLVIDEVPKLLKKFRSITTDDEMAYVYLENLLLNDPGMKTREEMQRKFVKYQKEILLNKLGKSSLMRAAGDLITDDFIQSIIKKHSHLKKGTKITTLRGRNPKIYGIPTTKQVESTDYVLED